MQTRTASSEAAKIVEGVEAVEDNAVVTVNVAIVNLCAHLSFGAIDLPDGRILCGSSSSARFFAFFRSERRLTFTCSSAYIRT